jgi:nitrogen fixation protein FixH
MSATQPRRSGWIPWVFVGGMLLVVAVNGGLIYAAISTFTGVAVSRPYERGRQYNQVLDEAARQAALGWQAQVVLEADALRVDMRDRDGLPLPGRLDGVLQRPIEGTTLPLEFAAVGPGVFAAPVRPKPGQWEARLRLTGPGGHLDIRQRVIAR